MFFGSIALEALYEQEVKNFDFEEPLSSDLDVSDYEEDQQQQDVFDIKNLPSAHNKRSHPNEELDLPEDYEEEEVHSGEDIPLPRHRPHIHQAANNSNLQPAKVVKKKQVKPIAEQVYKVVPVPVDDQGKPKLPFVLGLHTVHSLGKIVFDRPGFHSNRYIYPPGFHTSRTYLSVRNPNISVVWHSKVLDDGGPTPVFSVTAEDDPQHPVTGGTSTGVWSAIMRQAAQVRGKEPAGSASGPDMFGFTTPTIMQLIEGLEGAEKCLGYERKKYEFSTGKRSLAKALDSQPTPTLPSSDAMP